MKKTTPIFITKISQLYTNDANNKLSYNFDRSVSDNLNRANALIIKNNNELDLLNTNEINPFMFNKINLPVIKYLDNAICELTKWIDLLTYNGDLKNDLQVLRSEIAHHIFLISNEEKENN